MRLQACRNKNMYAVHAFDLESVAVRLYTYVDGKLVEGLESYRMARKTNILQSAKVIADTHV